MPDSSLQDYVFEAESYFSWSNESIAFLKMEGPSLDYKLKLSFSEVKLKSYDDKN